MRYALLLITILIIMWMSAPRLVQGQTSTRIVCRTDPANVEVGAEAVLIVSVENIDGLYGYEFKMRYAPELIGFIDQDGAKEEINLALGPFLSPDFVVKNRADEATGLVELALAQIAPSQPKSGSGELARIPFTGRAEGVAPFSLENVIASDPNGNQITTVVENCSITIGRSGQPTPTPTDTPMPTSTLTTPPTATPATTATNMPSATNSPATATPAQPATNTPLPTTTDIPSPTVTPTVVISAPTPAEVNGAAMGNLQNGPAAVPTQTPLPESGSPDPSSEVTLQTTNSSNTAVQPANDQDSAETVAISDTAEPTAVSEVPTIAPTVTPTATATPQKIAQIANVDPLPVQSIEQPATMTSNGGFTLAFWGQATLIGAGALLAGAWYLRRSIGKNKIGKNK